MFLYLSFIFYSASVAEISLQTVDSTTGADLYHSTGMYYSKYATKIIHRIKFGSAAE